MIAEYIASHQAEFWWAFGFVLLVLEVTTGFTTGILMFAGLGAVATGIMMSIGVLPQTWVAGISCAGISSGVITALLWRPLKNLQGRDHVEPKDNSSDLIGREFVVTSEITKTKPGSTMYSGITWRVEIDPDTGIDTLNAGQKVAVTSVEVGLFRVKPV